MTCGRCHGWAVPEVVEIDEGRLISRRCLNCGGMKEVFLIRQYHPRPDPLLIRRKKR